MSLIGLFLWCGASLATPSWYYNYDKAAPHDFDKIKVNKDIILDLKVGYESVPYGENFKIYLGIKNAGKKPLGLHKDFLIADQHEQLFFEAISSKADKQITQADWMPWWKRLEKLNDDQLISLEPNQYLLLSSSPRPSENWVYLSMNYPITPMGTQKIRASLLTGPNEWAFSEWIAIDRLGLAEADIFDAPVIKKFTYIKTRLEHRECEIRKARVQNEDYLYISLSGSRSSHRMARIPEGASPRIEIEGENLETKVVVHFDGSEHKPLVHWVSQIRTLEGSVETAPHLKIVQEIEKKMKEGKSENLLTEFRE